jgi:hypothetical protein
MPFLELWHEPTEVATRPPQFMFPLAVCQHISPSLVPADNEWTFVVNFETVAIRFSCNSRQIMEEVRQQIRSLRCGFTSLHLQIKSFAILSLRVLTFDTPWRQAK